MLRVVILAVCMTAAFAAEWEKPAFCNENDCPEYTVVSAENGYEVREYPPAMWVSTVVTAVSQEEADEQLSIAFNRLFKYIEGDNVRGIKIDMTTPVTTKVVPASGPNGETVFTRSFYIPYNLQDNPPAPSSPDVFLQQSPQDTVYVRSFTDYATLQDHMDNVMALAEAVGDDSFVTEYFYLNGYDSPYKWWDRHNEDWLVVKSTKESKQH